MWQKLFKILILLVFLWLYLISPVIFAATLIGQMVWVKGSVTAIDPQNVSRVLARQAPLYEGDKIVTNNSGSGQLVFTDGSLLAVRSDTEIILTQYHYDKKTAPQENHFLLNLIKGGFRTITGFIAHSDPDNYAVKTPVATIGVRGTDYSLFYSTSIGLNAKLNQGRIVVANNAGKIELNVALNKIYAQITDLNKTPVIQTNPTTDVFNKQPAIIPAPAPTSGGSPPPSNGSPSGTNTTNSTTSSSSGGTTNTTDTGSNTTSTSTDTTPSTQTTQPAICITN